MHEVRGYESRSRCQAKEQNRSRAAEMSKMHKMDGRQNPMWRTRLGWGGGDHKIIHAFCPADSMHEVRLYEARSRCQAIEQDMSSAAEMSKMQ